MSKVLIPKIGSCITCHCARRWTHKQHQRDGRELQVTEVAVVDELAAAAELVMGKSTGVPVAVLRGVDPAVFGPGSDRSGVLTDIVRSPTDDLFR